MDSRLESKMNMYDAVITYCNDNGAITATVPAFQTALTALISKFSSITATAQLEIQEISGITIDKSVLRKNLAQQAADIGAAVFAYASSVGNNELREQVRFSFSKLIGLKDELLAPACQNIHDGADANIASLAPYGITAATLTSFQDTIDDYTDTIPAPRNAASQRAAYATSLKNLFSEADDILKNQLDKIAPQFKAANLEFYNTYKNNRIIIDAATSVTQVTGSITNQNNLDPESGVSVSVVGQSYSTTSDANGGYTLKIPVPGTYSIKFSKDGFQDNTINDVLVKLGQSTQLNVTITQNT